MNLFRSEEHVARWLGGRNPGARGQDLTLSDLFHVIGIVLLRRQT